MRSRSFLFLWLISSTIATCPLETIFDNRFNKCYKHVTQAASFLLAEKNCQSMGGSLVTVRNIYEDLYISEIAGLEASDRFWIGLNFLMSNQWTWINGEVSTHRNWASLQPQNQNCNSCGAVSVADNQWRTAQCNIELPYTCQIEPNAVPASTSPSPATVALSTPFLVSISMSTLAPTPRAPIPCLTGSCPTSGYYLNPNNCQCYKYYSMGSGAYNKSLQFCASDNATLPIIRSDEDNQFISNLLRTKYSSHRPWLGLDCVSNTTNSCTWLDGTPLGFSNFEPANQHAWIEPGYGTWRTLGGTDSAYCLCQKPGIP